MNYAATLPKNEQKARSMMIEEWIKMVDGGITEEEFDNAVKYTIGIYQISQQSNSSLRDQYARNILMGRGLDYIEKFPELVRTTTLEQVKSIAAEFTMPDGIALGVVRAITNETVK